MDEETSEKLGNAFIACLIPLLLFLLSLSRKKKKKKKREGEKKEDGIEFRIGIQLLSSTPLSLSAYLAPRARQ